ncbi:MAG: OadG family transporter subunit [Lacrimispora sp.]
MKLNVKRIVLGLTMAVCLLSLSACGKSGTVSDTTAQTGQVDESVRPQLEQLPADYLKFFANLQDADFAALKARMEGQAQYEALSTGADTWQSIKNDLGSLVSVEDKALVKSTSDGYMATAHAVFEKREMDFSITTDPGLTKVISVEFSPEYTTGERLGKGEYNGPIGVAVILLGLIVFGLYKYIAVSKKGNKPAFIPAAQEARPALDAPVQTGEREEERNLSEDLELVAVITAAIAASTGTSPNDLVVRSIRRAPAGKWKNA